MWKFVIPVAAFVALAVLFAFGLNPNRDIHALPSPLIGKAAPKLDLTDVMDPSRRVDTASLKGQVYVLNVWGTWCIACREEHEELLAIASQHVVPLIGLSIVGYVLINAQANAIKYGLAWMAVGIVVPLWFRFTGKSAALPVE